MYSRKGKNAQRPGVNGKRPFPAAEIIVEYKAQLVDDTYAGI